MLTIFDVEPLDHQIVASSESQVILAEPSILRLLGYIIEFKFKKEPSVRTLKYTLVSAAVAFALTGCGSDSADTTTSTPITLSVSDAPIDNVSEVVVTYSKVAFLPEGEGEPQIFDVYKTDDAGNFVDEEGNPLAEGEDPIPLSVNLLDFQGSNAQALVDGQVIPTGNYQLCVFANDGSHLDYPSYVIEQATGNQVPLTVKGNGKCPQGVGEETDTGVLFFNDTFAVNTANNDYVVEFDLRRGLKEATGQDEGYTIQRTSVSLINTVTTGDIIGDVALNETYIQCESDNAGLASEFAHAVYLYEGNIEQTEMGTLAASEKQPPVATANVILSEDKTSATYEFGFVEPGTYSVGYTCTANVDSEDGAVEGESFSIYSASANLTVVAGSKTDANL